MLLFQHVVLSSLNDQVTSELQARRRQRDPYSLGSIGSLQHSTAVAGSHTIGRGECAPLCMIIIVFFFVALCALLRLLIIVHVHHALM